MYINKASRYLDFYCSLAGISWLSQS